MGLMLMSCGCCGRISVRAATEESGCRRQGGVVGTVSVRILIGIRTVRGWWSNDGRRRQPYFLIHRNEVVVRRLCLKGIVSGCP